MKSYTLRPDTFTLNVNFTLSGTRRSLLWGKASHAARVGMLDDDDDDDEYGDHGEEYVNFKNGVVPVCSFLCGFVVICILHLSAHT